MDLRKLVVVGVPPGVLDDANLQRLKALTDTIITLPRGDALLSDELADADGRIIGFAVPIPAEPINAAPHLAYLGVASTAYDAVDVAHARARGVTVTTLPATSTPSHTPHANSPAAK